MLCHSTSSTPEMRPPAIRTVPPGNRVSGMKRFPLLSGTLYFRYLWTRNYCPDYCTRAKHSEGLVPVTCVHSEGVSAFQGSGLEGLHFTGPGIYIEKAKQIHLFHQNTGRAQNAKFTSLLSTKSKKITEKSCHCRSKQNSIKLGLE